MRLFLFGLMLCSGFKILAQDLTISGTYHSETHEKDSTGTFNKVYHVIKIQEDSTFTYTRSQKNLQHCQSVHAGFWQLSDTSCILNFVGEPAWNMPIRTSSEFISLTQQEKRLIFYRPLPYPKSEYVPSNKPRKKVKDTPCFSF